MFTAGLPRGARGTVRSALDADCVPAPVGVDRPPRDRSRRRTRADDAGRGGWRLARAPGGRGAARRRDPGAGVGPPDRLHVRARRLPQGDRPGGRPAPGRPRDDVDGGVGMSTPSTPATRPAPATVAARAGIGSDPAYWAVVPGPVLSSTFSFAALREKRQYDFTSSVKQTCVLSDDTLV